MKNGLEFWDFNCQEAVYVRLLENNSKGIQSKLNFDNAYYHSSQKLQPSSLLSENVKLKVSSA
jgi:hypothetical protein